MNRKGAKGRKGKTVDMQFVKILLLFASFALFASLQFNWFRSPDLAALEPMRNG